MRLKHEYTPRTPICRWIPCTYGPSDDYRNFIPDSGRILHMRTPKPSADVRIDAGFRAGDEVSSFYDPMIAKLIVRAEDRATALQKLAAALEEYEIAGLSTNVEFLKTICRHPDFVSGDVETGFIPKHTDSLFAKREIPVEAYAQAAIGIVMSEHAEAEAKIRSGVNGFTGSSFNRQLKFRATEQGAPEINVSVSQNSTGTFGVQVGDTSLSNISAKWDSNTRILTSLLPSQRVETRLILDADKVMLFQHGTQFILHHVTPSWLEKALGIKDTTHSVLAPMPCKVLRVEVKEGDHVAKDQPLVVIESMKMETVIRSPQEGVVAKVVHQQGVSLESRSSEPKLTYARTCVRLARHWWSLKSEAGKEKCESVWIPGVMDEWRVLGRYIEACFKPWEELAFFRIDLCRQLLGVSGRGRSHGFGHSSGFHWLRHF
jgi:3-methylcrotonyl-CoA carboxylase alpha subunit